MEARSRTFVASITIGWLAMMGLAACSNGASVPAAEHVAVSTAFQSTDGGNGGDAGSCSCTGVDIAGEMVTVNQCGETVCGADDVTWVCTTSGFEYQGNSCSASDAGGACPCAGTDVNGNTVTANSCGQTVCGADDLTWVCTEQGFVYQGDACPVCNCTGTDNNGNNVTVTQCGDVVCGADNLTWVCTTNGFDYQGDSCAKCSCTGTNLQGNLILPRSVDSLVTLPSLSRTLGSYSLQ